MKQNHLASQILAYSQKGRKTYSFNEEHNKNRPIEIWFQRSHEGLILFVVFYTRACRWSRCLSCSLPSRGSQFPVSYKALIRQIDYVFSKKEVVRRRKRIKKIIISNNGSILDEETFSSTALIYLLAKINLILPSLAVISIETRPEYVEMAELEFLGRTLKEGNTPTDLELAVGIETFDSRIRNRVFNKGLSLAAIEKLAAKAAGHDFRLKCYFMQKPVPDMSDEEAMQDIKQAINYLSDLAKKHRVRINLHLNPTYVASGTLLEQSFIQGQYTPPRLVDVARAALHAEGKGISVFIGLSDENLAVSGGSFIRSNEEEIVQKLEAFNRTQNFNTLRSLIRRQRAKTK